MRRPLDVIEAERKGEGEPSGGRFIRGHRLSGTGLLTVDGMVTSTMVEGSMTMESFCEFLKENVVRKSAIACVQDLTWNQYDSYHFVHHFQGD
jgi:hypothetical protein